MTANIHYVNNTGSDLRMVWAYFQEAYVTNELHEDVSDLFNIRFIDGINKDGTKRMIIKAA